jgi:hypothetical protein
MNANIRGWPVQFILPSFGERFETNGGGGGGTGPGVGAATNNRTQSDKWMATMQLTLVKI